MELDFDKYCVVEGSPTTVLQSSKVGNRKLNRKLKCGNDIQTINENFAQIRFNRYRSASYRDVPRRSAKREDNEVLRRGSVYQSSSEVRLTKKTAPVEGRKKIEFSRGSAPALPFGIIDSLCSSEEDSLPVERKRSSVMSLYSEQSTTSVSNPCTELNSRNPLNDYFHPYQGKRVPPNVSSLRFDNRENQSVVDANNQLVQDPKITCEPMIGPVNDGNTLRERDEDVNYHKSLSAKMALLHSPSRSETDSSRASSPKAQFSPVRKMFDPFIKAKSYRSPLSSANEAGQETVIGIKPNKTLQESLPREFAGVPNDLEYNSQCQKKENCSSVSHSPAHLHGILKLENKHEAPIFKFSVKSPEDVYVAKTWKPENALTWVYTFHSLHRRRKSNASGWGLRNDNKESAMVGQMQVSCHLRTELKCAGAFDNSMVTEFVLYNLAHPIKRISSQDNSNLSPDVAKAPRASDEFLSCCNSELDQVSTRTKTLLQLKHSRDSGHFDSSTPCPLPAAELHPELEIAAIIMQAPFKKRESLKFKSWDRENDKLISQLLGVCGIKQRKAAGIADSANPGKMHVVIPSGNHSLPSSESCGPSPLLDRWRLGGGCDCGGWDMACPLNIFGNPDIQIAEDHPPVDNQHPMELFIQGRKDNTPALTMRATEDGQYAIDFHAHLSSLQAFSICIAILHTAEVSTSAGKERNKQALQCDSMRVFAKQEISSLIDEIAEEEKCEVNKKMKEVLPSFVLDPPFSPIARV